MIKLPVASKTIPSISKKVQLGFTLIELVIVAVIIGILSAIAIPAYQTYTLRAQVSEALSSTSSARHAISNYYKYTGKFPIDNFASGLPKPDDMTGKYIQNITVADGAIHVRFIESPSQLASKIVTLRPVYTEGAPTAPIHFVCGYAKPKNTLQKATGENKTDIDKNWLPTACRSESEKQ